MRCNLVSTMNGLRQSSKSHFQSIEPLFKSHSQSIEALLLESKFDLCWEQKDDDNGLIADCSHSNRGWSSHLKIKLSPSLLLIDALCLKKICHLLKHTEQLGSPQLSAAWNSTGSPPSERQIFHLYPEVHPVTRDFEPGSRQFYLFSLHSARGNILPVSSLLSPLRIVLASMKSPLILLN